MKNGAPSSSTILASSPVADAADAQRALLEQRLITGVQLVGAVEVLERLGLAVETSRHCTRTQEYPLLAVQAWLTRRRDLTRRRRDQRFFRRDTILGMPGVGQAEFIAGIL